VIQPRPSPQRGEQQQNLPERLPLGAAVDHCWFLEVERQGLHVGGEIPDRQRDREGQIRRDHRLLGIDPANVREQAQQRHNDGDAGDIEVARMTLRIKGVVRAVHGAAEAGE
jgi:hypothetical protein